MASGRMPSIVFLKRQRTSTYQTKENRGIHVIKANDNKEKQVKTKKLAWLNRLSTVFKIKFLPFGQVLPNIRINQTFD